ncbi:hypothetical protein HYX08_06795 [Candidatus Woesearchaeota archaeon]|nr:hypothetical protein [Candidatus Woesearchaeota archaeon]
MRFKSISEWKNYCFNTHKAYLKNRYFSCWIKQKKVDIFNYTSLEKGALQDIKKSVEGALRLCKGSSKVTMLTRNPSELNFAVKNSILIGKDIMKMVKKSRKKDKSCSARIFLANKRAAGNGLLRFGDALTYVSDGMTIFTFDPSVKYPKRFFRDEVKHEIYHLLGLNAYHEDTEVKGYGKLSKCNMEYNAPSEILCQKCRDGLMSFWEGVKNAKSS